MIVKSRQNSAVKFARKLHSKKFRDLENLFIFEGARYLCEILNSSHPLHTLFLSKNIDKPWEKVASDLSSVAGETIIADDEIMEYISPAKTSQKMLAILPQKEWNIKEVIKEGKYFIALNRIKEPGNLGTIIRSAQAFGCGGIFLVGDCVEVYNPKTVRASAGYVLTMPVIKMESPESFLKTVKNFDLTSAALAAHRENLFQPIKNEKTVYIFGGETHGLMDLENHVKHLFSIDICQNVESLNLSTSASIVMSEIYKNFKNI